MPASLVKPYRRFLKETTSLAHILESTASPSAHTRHQQLIREMCVIRLHDAWARFCRELVVLSTYAQPLTAQGQRVPRVSGIRDRQQVIPALIKTYQRRTAEPFWHIPMECIDAAHRLNVANYSAIAGGLGRSSPQSPTDQLRQMRNFFAHRNVDTAQDVTQIALSLGMPNVRYPHLAGDVSHASGCAAFRIVDPKAEVDGMAGYPINLLFYPLDRSSRTTLKSIFLSSR